MTVPLPAPWVETFDGARQNDEKLAQQFPIGPTQHAALAWTAPTLLNSWVNYDAANFSNAGYVKDNEGFVHLRGVVGSGVAATVFTLPSGFRPARRAIFSVVGNDLFARVDVATTGDVVVIVGAGGTLLQLDGITFDTR